MFHYLFRSTSKPLSLKNVFNLSTTRSSSCRIRSRVMPDKVYRFGNNPHHKEQTVFLGDAEYLLSLLNGESPQWRVLTRGASMERRDPAAVLGVAIGV